LKCEIKNQQNFYKRLKEKKIKNRKIRINKKKKYMKTLRTQIFVWRVKLKRKKIKDQIEKKITQNKLGVKGKILKKNFYKKVK
jgi:glycyl-tRNA synthetase beta subunit